LTGSCIPVHFLLCYLNGRIFFGSWWRLYLWRSSRPGNKACNRCTVPELVVKGGKNNRLTKHFLPEHCSSQMDCIVSPQTMVPRKSSRTSYQEFRYLQTDQIFPVSHKDL